MMNDEYRHYNNYSITTKLHDERQAIIGFNLNVFNNLILSEVGNTIDTCMLLFIKVPTRI